MSWLCSLCLLATIVLYFFFRFSLCLSDLLSNVFCLKLRLLAEEFLCFSSFSVTLLLVPLALLPLFHSLELVLWSYFKL